MAKIKQLSESYRRQTKNVSGEAVDVRPLSEGLSNISDAYANRIKFHNDARIQRDSEELQRAQYEFRDWYGKYVTNMDTPGKIQEAFGGTIYADDIPGYMSNSDNLESSVAQTHVKLALDRIGTSFSNSKVAESFILESLMSWEDNEQAYNNQSQAFIQQKSKLVFMANLEKIASEEGPHSEKYNNESAKGIDLGYFGPKADKAFEDASTLKHAYTVAAQSRGYEERLFIALAGVQGQDVPDSAVEAILLAVEIGDIHGNFMSKEDVKSAQTRAINRAQSTNAMFKDVAEQAEEKILGRLQADVNILIGPNELTRNQSLLAKQALIQKLVGYQTNPYGPHKTGIDAVPTAYVGQLDRGILQTQIDMLRTSLTSYNIPEDVNMDAMLGLENIFWDITINPANKRIYGSNAFNNNKIDDKQLLDYNERISNEYNKPAYKAGASAYKEFVDTFTTATQEDLSKIGATFSNILSGIEDENIFEIEQQFNAALGNYISKNGHYEKGGISIMTAGEVFMFDTLRTRNPQLDQGASWANADLASVIRDTENGHLTDMVKTYPDSFNQLNYQTNLAFSTWSSKQLNNLDFENLSRHIDGFGHVNVKIAATLTGSQGEPLVCIPIADTDETFPGLLQVRVFSPTMKENSFWSPKDNRIQFVEENESETYWLKNIIGEDGSITTDEFGGIRAEGFERILVVNKSEKEGFNSGATRISQDPVYLSSISDLSNSYNPKPTSDELERLQDYEDMVGE